MLAPRSHIHWFVMSVVAISHVLPAVAQEKFDIAKQGPPTRPVANVTVAHAVTYAGGTAPANVKGMLGLNHSTFNRPLDCAHLSHVGDATPYDTITITNKGANTATLNLRMGPAAAPQAACPVNADTVMVVYDGSFIPASPLTNCVAINDDANAADRCSTLKGVAIPSGKTRVVVLTLYKGGTTFDYEVSFAGSFPVELQQFSVD